MPSPIKLCLILITCVFILASVPAQSKRRGPKPKASPSPTPTATPSPTPVPLPSPTPTLLRIEPVSRSVTTLGLEDTHLTINRPPNTTAGDFLIAHLGGVPGAITLSAPAGWFFLRQDYNDTFNPFTGYANYKAAIYFKVITSDEPESYTWVLSSTPLGYSGAITAYRGVDTLSPIDAHDGAPAGVMSDGYASSEITTTVPDTYLLLLVSIDAFALAPDNRGCLAPAGMDQRYEVLNSDNFIAGVDVPNSSVGPIGPITINCIGNGAPGIVAAVALRPAQ